MNSRSLRRPKGAISIVFAALLIIALGFFGLAIDVGYAHVQKTRLQAIADAAALACVIDNDTCGAGGNNRFPAVNLANVDVQITNPVGCPAVGTQSECARAVASNEWSTFVFRVFGTPTARAQATAVAGRRAAMPSCITTIQNFRINGTNTLGLDNCTADIGGALLTTNQSGIRAAEGSTGAITVYNGNDPSTCGNCSPEPTGSTTALPTPPSYPIPTTNLDGTPLVNRQRNDCRRGVCEPGRYSGLVTLNGDTTFASGTYVFEGGLNTNGQSLRNGPGGVSVYVPGDAALTLTGDITLSAPTPEACLPGTGVVISHSLSGPTRSLDLNGSRVSLNLTGIVNLSADDVTISGASSSFSLSGTVIANSITLNGNMYPKISSNSCNNVYQRSRVVLVE